MSGSTTGRSAYDADGNLLIYVPPNVIKLAPGDLGQTVTYGEWVELAAGDPLPGPGIYEITDGAAGLSASNPVTYRTVTISQGSKL